MIKLRDERKDEKGRNKHGDRKMRNRKLTTTETSII
jgi:hypothetical protein